MRVLFATGSNADYMMPPRLGDEQVNCGPHWKDDVGPDGRVRSLATPKGSYDLAAIAAKLPSDQQPDVVVCLTDSAGENRPQNLAAFRCPRVLLVADLHHMRSPLIGMMRYMAGEPFDRHIFLYDRHFVSVFQGAGLRNLHWLPGLTFPHDDAAVHAARHETRTPQLAFVGQTGKHHPRRTRLMGALAVRGVPVAQKQILQREALEFYGSSLAGFNASLNGDLNLRVFEIISSGALLLTDRLAPSAGLDRILCDGRDVVTYSNVDEFAERAAYYLAHPAEAHTIAQAGANWFDAHWSATHRRAAFESVVFNGTVPAEFEFDATETTKVFFGGDTDRLLQSLMVFEGVQELHRVQENVRVSLDAKVPADFAEICATLPRVECCAAGDGQADLDVFDRALADAALSRGAQRIWCWNAEGEDFDALSQTFATAGYALQSRDVAVWCRPDAAPDSAAEAKEEVAQARALFEQGNHRAALALAKTALEKDRRSFGARVLLGELSLLGNNGELAEKLARQALEVQPRDSSAQILLGDALRAQGRLKQAEKSFERVLANHPGELRALLGMARLRETEKKFDAAETLLRTAARKNPSSRAVSRVLGDLLKRRGRVIEALGWHRHACGGPAEVESPRTGRRRAVFVVQHGPAWPSTASVYAAFAADPEWETTIVAMPYLHPFYKTDAERNAVFEFLTKENIPHVRWDAFALTDNCADVIFLHNPYDVTRPAAWRTDGLMKFVPRIAYVPYEIDISGGDSTFEMLYNEPLQKLAWAVFARSERHRRMFSRYCGTGDAHVEVTGHPKTDQLRTLAEFRSPEIERFAAGREIVFWNPHWEIKPDGSDWGAGCSTFMHWWKIIPQAIARRPGLALVIRPHPLFFAALQTRGILTEVQLDEFQARCAASGCIHIDRGASYLAVFASAAAILSDASSFLLEFAATGKPVGYLHNPRGRGLSEDGAFIRDHCATVESEAALETFLDAVEGRSDPRRAARMAALHEYLFIPADGVGVAIKHAVERRLATEGCPVGDLAPATEKFSINSITPPAECAALTS